MFTITRSRILLTTLVLVTTALAGCAEAPEGVGAAADAPEPAPDAAASAENAAALAALRERLAEKNATIRGLEENLEAAESNLSKRDKMLRSRDRQVSELKRVLDEWEGYIEELEARLARYEDGSGEATATGDQFPQETVDQARDVALTARESTVYLSMNDGASSGTGWYVDEDLIVTNWHVVDAAASGSDITAWTMDGTSFSVEILGTEESPDVALLRAETPGTPLPVGESGSLTRDDPLVQVGHPGGVGNWVISLGAYLEGGQYVDYNGFLTTIPGLSGVSGSAVLDMNGNVVGLTYAGSPHVQPPGPGEAPKVADNTVHTDPLVAISDGDHVAIEDVMALVETWR